MNNPATDISVNIRPGVIYLKDGQNMEHVIGQLQSLSNKVLCVLDGTTLKIENERDTSGKLESTIKGKYATETYYRRDDDTLCCYFTPVVKPVDNKDNKDVKPTDNKDNKDVKPTDNKDVKPTDNKDNKSKNKEIKSSADNLLDDGIALSDTESELNSDELNRIHTVKDSDDDPTNQQKDEVPNTVDIRYNDDPNTVLTLKKV